MIGKKVVILRDGMSKYDCDFEAISGVHPLTVKFHRDSYCFKEGSIGVIKDINALGTRFIVKVRGYNKLQYVPIEWVQIYEKA